MHMFSTICALALAAALWLANAGNPFAHAQRAGSESPAAALAYLGFDSNDYPGDAALPVLRRTFSFAGYWLNPPPGTASNTWAGKRAVLREGGFGFLVLFNGRTSRQLRRPADAATLGARDARIAADRAKQEGFSMGTVIFLDQEEGGRLLPEQRDYLFSWIDGVIAAGFDPGVYCSGIPAKEGKREFIVTANDIRDHAGARNIAFFVYNDECPPSPGCVCEKSPPLPSASGVLYASVWQFSQSPRRQEFTSRCARTYSPDGNCYPPGTAGPGPIFLDLDSATSSDPSHGRC